MANSSSTTVTTIGSGAAENIKIVQKSFVILFFQSLAAWIIATLIFIGLGILWQNIQSSLFTPTNTVVPDNTIVSSSTSEYGIFTAILLALYGLILLFMALDWIYELYVIEPHSVVIRKGFLFTKEEHFDLEGVHDVVLQQGFFGKLFHYGTIILYNPQLKREASLTNIPDPEEIASLLGRFPRKKEGS